MEAYAKIKLQISGLSNPNRP